MAGIKSISNWGGLGETMEKREYWYWFVGLNGIRREKLMMLLEEFGEPERIYKASSLRIESIPWLEWEDIKVIAGKEWRNTAGKELEMLKQKEIGFISPGEEEYPEKLRHIYNYPMGLYQKGRLPKEGKTSIAIIGARDCSLYGKEIAQYFGRELAKSGIQVISGLAKGIDGYAHIGALSGQGYTLGVLGSGIDVCYPRGHHRLYQEMCQRGGILSEYGPGTWPAAWNFPQRNRIISGISDGILVIEAREKSGTHITIEHGLEQGKDIFVLPGRITDELSKGCNNLMKAGAIPVTEPKDILDFYGFVEAGNKISDKKKNYVLENHEEMVYSKLCLEPKHLNELMEECELSLYLIMETLVSLELKGYIKEPVKNYYIKSI